MQDLKYDIRRGADTYSAVYHPRLKSWILKGIINRDEALVWRSGLSGWRKPEDLNELKPYFEKREEERKGSPQAEQATHLFAKKKIRRILIIDDEEDLCWLLSSALSLKGYHVSTANRLEQGIALLEEKPDLIFLDLKLPDGDGMNILPVINEKSPETLVVVISAYGSKERMADASDKGVHGFIDKPFTEERIAHFLKKFQTDP